MRVAASVFHVEKSLQVQNLRDVTDGSVPTETSLSNLRSDFR